MLHVATPAAVPPAIVSIATSHALEPGRATRPAIGVPPATLPVDLDPYGARHRNLWAARLDEAVRQARDPIMLVAQGDGCLALAWWARLSPRAYTAKVLGALMMAPADPADKRLRAFADCPDTRLPFPSIVMIGKDESQADIDHARHLAAGWGSRFLETSLQDCLS